MSESLPRERLRRIVTDVAAFSQALLPRQRLRPYQIEPARAIAESVIQRRGDQFAVVFSRQAGKDEMLAQLLAMLLLRFSQRGGSIVVAAPTYRPQAALSRDRLRDRLQANPLTAPLVTVRDGYALGVGRATARFLSAAPGANARGQTADLLLVANEAQDIDPDTWDAVFDPMAASTNATTVFMGTVWSASTLLARQMRHLARMEDEDGRQRIFRVPWDTVAAEIPAYGDRVRARIAQLGETHPFVRTKYFLQELDGESSLFPPHRLAQMQGDHPRQHRATPGCRYALLLDVAGEEEAGGDQLAFSPGNARRDSTALTVVAVESAERTDGRASYRVVDRRIWTGIRHTALHDQLVDLARNVWKASWVVVDATGIGAGLASFLQASLGRRSGSGDASLRVVPFAFTSASKSKLGWDFLGLIDSGRFKEYADDREEATRLYQTQLSATTFEIMNGPGNILRWSVPERDGHDDLVISAALCAVLDDLDPRPRVAVGS
ncbi:MAG TPA: hypothetical protein VFQ54_08390 [Thermomicrobiales bacterium]|nr:hypothetical protein [Thermomicrobiales bacterium]